MEIRPFVFFQIPAAMFAFASITGHSAVVTHTRRIFFTLISFPPFKSLTKHLWVTRCRSEAKCSGFWEPNADVCHPLCIPQMLSHPGAKGERASSIELTQTDKVQTGQCPHLCKKPGQKTQIRVFYIIRKAQPNQTKPKQKHFENRYSTNLRFMSSVIHTAQKQRESPNRIEGKMWAFQLVLRC